MTTPNERLFAAAKAGDIGGVRAALADGAEVMAVAEEEPTRNRRRRRWRLSSLINSGNYHPHEFAAKIGHAHIVDYLRQMGADIFAHESLAFLLAAENNNTEVVSLFLEIGVDLHDRNEALQSAAHVGHADMIRLLLDSGADASAYSNIALYYATTNGHKEVVSLFLEKIGCQTANETARLLVAANKGQTQEIREALQAGADIHADYDLALLLAAERGRREATRELSRGDAGASECWGQSKLSTTSAAKRKIHPTQFAFESSRQTRLCGDHAVFIRKRGVYSTSQHVKRSGLGRQSGNNPDALASGR
jgi:hypothetical protein